MGLLHYLYEALSYAFLLICFGVLPWLLCAGLFQLLSRSLQRSFTSLLGLWPYVYITAPGVAIHELGHVIFCLLFRHRIHELKLFSPEKDGTLGYVNHSYNPRSPYQRCGNFFIGTGPIWGGLTVLAGISWLLLPHDMLVTKEQLLENLEYFYKDFFTTALWTRWQTYLWLYLAIAIASHITLSPPDLKGAGDGLLALLVLIVLSCVGLGWAGSWEDCVIDFLKQSFFQLLPMLSAMAAILVKAVWVMEIISDGKTAVSPRRGATPARR